MRMIHHQMWISVSRYRTAKGDNRILDRSIEFDQVDRERNWYVRLSPLRLHSSSPSMRKFLLSMTSTPLPTS